MTRSVDKLLNVRADGSFFVYGYPPTALRLDYIPAQAIHETLLKCLQPGDYVGIYSPWKGWMFLMPGLLITRREKTSMRHASSLSGVRKVVDVEIVSYLKTEIGLIVLRLR